MPTLAEVQAALASVPERDAVTIYDGRARRVLAHRPPADGGYATVVALDVPSPPKRDPEAVKQMFIQRAIGAGRSADAIVVEHTSQPAPTRAAPDPPRGARRRRRRRPRVT